MYTNNREAYRHTFFTVWQKHLKKLPLEAVEAQLLDVILQHPEYHRFLDKPESNPQQEFALEENPFFHMGLHLAVREQIHTNRPAGISLIQQQLKAKEKSPHDSEHLMMECLMKMMWKTQQTETMPSEEEYMTMLKSID
jgi:hypothetical protein